MSNNRVRPLSSKAEALKSIDVPTKVRGVQKFVRIVNYYREMWRKRAHTLSPLTKLCSTKVKFKWADVENNSFIEMKKIVVRDVLLYYPKFSEKFIINTDANNTQLGEIISQNGKPIAFYSQKLTPAKMNYTTIEKELFSIMENLKKSCTII